MLTLNVHAVIIQRGGQQQVGTLAIEGTPGSKSVVFWSDTVVHFEPQFLGFVPAGDLVKATMTLGGKGWEVAVDDLTSSLLFHLTVTGEPSQGFNRAQWFQEDPSSGAGPSIGRAPYLTTSSITFTHVEANGSQPRTDFADTRWMGLMGPYALRPTPIEHQSFGIREVRIGKTALQYLDDTAPFNNLLTTFNQRLNGWGPTTTTQSFRLAAAPLLGALRTQEKAIARQSWPPQIKALLGQFEGANSVIIGGLVALSQLSPTGLPAWRDRNAVDQQRAHQIVLRLHGDLGVPIG